jgi:hypothetical protein
MEEAGVPGESYQHVAVTILHNERAVVMVVGFTTTFAINAYHH